MLRFTNDLRWLIASSGACTFCGLCVLIMIVQNSAILAALNAGACVFNALTARRYYLSLLQDFHRWTK